MESAAELDAAAHAAVVKQQPATPVKEEKEETLEHSPVPRVVPQAGLTRTNKRRRSLAGEAELLSDHNMAEKAVQEIKDDDQEPSKINKGLPGHLDYRWRTQTMCEDYVNMVADLMYPKLQFGAFGYDAEQQQYPLERMPTLGYLLSPLRRPTVMEKWSPYEISLFESAIMLYGKNFHMIQQIVNTKTSNEVIEFYYMWKQTSHYKYWKKVYVPDQLEDEDAAA